MNFGFITKNERVDLPNLGNKKRQMTDEQLKQLFEQNDIPTNEDHVAIIDSKANNLDVYNKDSVDNLFGEHLKNKHSKEYAEIDDLNISKNKAYSSSKVNEVVSREINNHRHDASDIDNLPSGGGGSNNAVDVNYDNSESGLTSINVQSAINEVNNKINETNLKVDENKSSIVEVKDIANSAKQRGDEVKILLVDALISIGLQASTLESFEEIINKLILIDKLEMANGISANFNTGGKRAATINGTGSYDLKKWVIVENISFKKNPKFVLVYFDYNGWLSTSIYSSQMNAVFAGMYKRDNITGDKCMAFNGSMLDVSVTKNRICIPMNPDLATAIDVNWIAIA